MRSITRKTKKSFKSSKKGFMKQAKKRFRSAISNTIRKMHKRNIMK